jgi:hypothetical protein
MSLKKSMLERIERDSIKIHVQGEDIFLKKKLGWHIIFPPVDMKSVELATDESGNVNWKKVKWNYTNLIFGGKSNAFKTFIVGLITILLAYGVWQIIASYNSFIMDPIVQGCLKLAGIGGF